MDNNGLKKKWKNRSTLEKILIVIVIILVALVLFLLIRFLSSSPENPICSKPECLKAANHILDMVDLSVDPCDDFYHFACGTFLKAATNHRSSLTPMSDLAKYQLRNVIMGPEDGNYSHGVKLQRQFWTSCINETGIKEDDGKTFLSRLDELGGWPILRGYSFDEGRFDWMSTMLKAAKIGLDYDFFLSIQSIYDMNVTQKNILLISPPFKQNLMNIEYPETLIEVMKQIATYLGAPSVGVGAEIRNVVNFIEEFNEIVNKAWNQSLEDINDLKIKNISTLNQKYVYKPWTVFLNNLTHDIVKITNEDRVMFRGEDYLRDLYYLLVRTNKRIQANYICWYMLIKNYQFMKISIREKVKRAINLKPDDVKNKDRAEECFWMSRKHFPYVAEGGYIRKYMDEKRIKDIKEIIMNIKEQFSLAFKYNEWMDDETKEMIQEKADDMTEAIGWSNLVYDAEQYERALEIDKMSFSSDNLMKMACEIRLSLLRKLFANINKYKLDLEAEADFPIIDINAYFIHGLNKIILPAPIIRGFIFNSNRPNYLNYGALGSIIGHELTHSFALTRHIREEYNFTWMTNQSTSTFHDKVQCVIEEYSNYINQSEGLKILKFQNTSASADENVADITGQIMSYRAYQDYQMKYGNEESLPGVNFSHNQIFWIMSSTYLCYNNNRHGDFMTKIDKFHSDSKLRVIGALMNSPYFAEDFDCPIGSNMNPKKKCTIFT